MVVAAVVWHGTDTEALALLAALDAWCRQPEGRTGQQCRHGWTPQQTAVCPAHRAFSQDQRYLDGLVYMRRLRERLIAEEWVGKED